MCLQYRVKELSLVGTWSRAIAPLHHKEPGEVVQPSAFWAALIAGFPITSNW